MKFFSYESVFAKCKDGKWNDFQGLKGMDPQNEDSYTVQQVVQNYLPGNILC